MNEKFVHRDVQIGWLLFGTIK